jgi:hypothetical protein
MARVLANLCQARVPLRPADWLLIAVRPVHVGGVDQRYAQAERLTWLRLCRKGPRDGVPGRIRLLPSGWSGAPWTGVGGWFST